MKKENNKNGLIVFLLIITLILVTLLALVATGKLDLKKVINGNDNKIEEKNNDKTSPESTSDTSNTTTEKPANWQIEDDVKKYVTLEDVKLSDEVTTKKVKLINLDDSLTSQFYKDQQAVIDNIHIYNDEYIKGGAEYSVKSFINNNILSVVYLLEEKNAVGICGTKMAVTNIDLVNKKVITQEELLNKVGTSYKELTEDYYNTELERWKKANEENNFDLDYYGVTLDDFSNNKDKYINEGLEKMPDIIYVYIEDGKIKYDYYSINMSTLFHQVGKGGCFNWETKLLGEYK